jgi:hypothetical protein
MLWFDSGKDKPVMNMIKLITICSFVLLCSLATAQDPQLIGKDGLPATKTPRSENYSRDSENQESRGRNRTVDQTKDQEQFKEEFASEEVQKESHFKSDTLTMRSFDEKSKRTIKPQNRNQPVKQDSVKTGTRKPTTSSGVRRVVK